MVAKLAADPEKWREAVRCAEILLNAGADPDARDASGRTALHYACKYKHWLLVRRLMKSWANDKLKDYKYRLPK